MSKSKSIVLNVPKPCTEGWDNMTSDDKGRHCTSCNKTVIDFTLYTDKELADFFKKISGNVCGRINNYQVNRSILITEQPNRSIFHRLFFSTALASWLGITSTASAQVYVSPNQSEQTDVKQQNGSGKYLKGILTDSNTNQALPFANIELKDNGSTLESVYTDIDGNFKFHIPNDLKNKFFTVRASYEGYIEKTLELNTSKLPPSINLQLNSSLLTIDSLTFSNNRHITMGKLDVRSRPTETIDPQLKNTNRIIKDSALKPVDLNFVPAQYEENPNASYPAKKP